MMRRLPMTLLVLLATLAGPSLALAQQSATVLRDTELRSEPFTDAPVVTKLRARTTLTILKRQGGWYRARQADSEGWVRMSTVRFGEATGSGSSGISETLQFLGSGRSGASGVTVATGIRGLDAADVANATPDHQAVKRLERIQVSEAQARAFASEGKLRGRSVPYLEPPQTGEGQQ